MKIKSLAPHEIDSANKRVLTFVRNLTKERVNQRREICIGCVYLVFQCVLAVAASVRLCFVGNLQQIATSQRHPRVACMCMSNGNNIERTGLLRVRDVLNGNLLCNIAKRSATIQWPAPPPYTYVAFSRREPAQNMPKRNSNCHG